MVSLVAGLLFLILLFLAFLWLHEDGVDLRHRYTQRPTCSLGHYHVAYPVVATPEHGEDTTNDDKISVTSNQISISWMLAFVISLVSAFLLAYCWMGFYIYI